MTAATYPIALPILEPAADGSDDQLLEISMGPQHPSTHGVFRMNVVLDGETGRQVEAGLRLPASQPRKDRRKRDLPRFDALHRPTGLHLLHHQQLGICSGGGKACGHPGAGTSRVPSRHHRRADPAAEPRQSPRIPAAGHGIQRDPADVRVPRAREDPRPVRGAHRLAHDVQLHALRRLPGGPARRLAGAGAKSGEGVSPILGRIRKPPGGQ